VRIPVPAALLVDHPAVPVPTVNGAATESPPSGDTVASTSLSRKERFSAALQLTAAASLLAEFDLWPGRRAIRGAGFRRTSSGLWASLSRFPVPMSRVYSRLGGGEGAAAATRTAALEAISDAVGLSPASIDDRKGEPGFFLEAAIARQLRELKQPLDACTARALWAFRWDGLPIPEGGETDYWKVPFLRLARRLGGSPVGLSATGAAQWSSADSQPGGIHHALRDSTPKNCSAIWRSRECRSRTLVG
jgi:hypothetical protein